MSDPLRERLIKAILLKDACGSIRSFSSGGVVKIVADDLADAVLEIVDGELGRLRRIENAARVVVEHWRECKLSAYPYEYLDTDLLDALAAEVERSDGEEKR